MADLVSLSKLVKVKHAMNPSSYGAGTAVETQVNGSGYNRAMFLIDVGTIGATATLAVKVYKSATSGSLGTYITGAVATLSTTGANKVQIIDVPIAAATPYLYALGTAGTSWVNAAASVVLYGGSRLNPPTQDLTAVIV